MRFLLFAVFLFTYLYGHRGGHDLLNSDLRLLERPNLELSYTSENFMIHYDRIGDDAPIFIDENNNSIPDYVESVAEIAEESRNILVNVMGYREEPSDEDGIYDIYVQNESRWGVNIPEQSLADPGSGDAGRSFVIIDNDYSEANFDSEYCDNYLDKMRISVAHEFFHAIQRSYRPDYDEDHDFMLEMSSMWFERLMVDNCSDYLTFTESPIGIFRNPNQAFDGSDIEDQLDQADFGYSMALFAHYLSRVTDSKGFEDQKSSDIIRKIWERYCYIEGSEDCPQNISPRDAIIQTIESDTFEDRFSRVWSDFIGRNMQNGSFSYFNQDIYYHEDQQYIPPPSVSITDVVSENESSTINLTLNPYSAKIVTLIAFDDMAINSTFSDNLDGFDGYYSLRGDVNTYNIIDNIDFNLNLNDMDTYYLILTSRSGTSNVDFSFEATVVPDLIFSVSKVYPNPIASNQNLVFKIETNSTIDFIDKARLNIELYNILGQKVGSFYNNIQLNSGYNDISIPLKKYINSSGTYIIKAAIDLGEYGYKNYSKKITVFK